MNFLLDTNAFLWLVAQPERLPDDVRADLADPENAVYFSAASAWEIAIKVSIGKLRVADPPRFVASSTRRAGCTTLAINLEHALRVGALPFHHRDPFDRMLIAQAQIEHMTIVTGDPAFADYDVAARII